MKMIAMIISVIDDWEKTSRRLSIWFNPSFYLYFSFASIFQSSQQPLTDPHVKASNINLRVSLLINSSKSKETIYYRENHLEYTVQQEEKQEIIKPLRSMAICTGKTHNEIIVLVRSSIVNECMTLNCITSDCDSTIRFRYMNMNQYSFKSRFENFSSNNNNQSTWIIPFISLTAYIWIWLNYVAPLPAKCPHVIIIVGSEWVSYEQVIVCCAECFIRAFVERIHDFIISWSDRSSVNPYVETKLVFRTGLEPGCYILSRILNSVQDKHLCIAL